MVIWFDNQTKWANGTSFDLSFWWFGHLIKWPNHQNTNQKKRRLLIWFGEQTKQRISNDAVWCHLVLESNIKSLFGPHLVWWANDQTAKLPIKRSRFDCLIIWSNNQMTKSADQMDAIHLVCSPNQMDDIHLVWWANDQKNDIRLVIWANEQMIKSFGRLSKWPNDQTARSYIGIDHLIKGSNGLHLVHLECDFIWF